MAPRSKTVADAIKLVEDLQKDFEEHRGEFKSHQQFTKDLESRVVNGEKAMIRTRGAYRLLDQKMDQIIDRLDNKRIGWQVWVPIALTALLTAIGLIVQLWQKVPAP